MKRVLKWAVPIDGEVHPIGGGPVVLVATQDPLWNEVQPSVHVWTEEEEFDPPLSRDVKVVGTGEDIPLEAVSLGSLVSGFFVWHVYETSI
jgi:hypothetical protein